MVTWMLAAGDVGAEVPGCIVTRLVKEVKVTQTDLTNSSASEAPEADLDAGIGDAGIGMTSVIVMLVVLAALVVGIFWALPAWFGDQVVEVTIRN